MPNDKVPIYTSITLDDIINCLKEVNNAPETKTIYIPNKGLATIPLKEYRKMMFDNGCLIYPKEMEEKINKEILDYGEENENSKGLGTTVVAAIVTKDFLIFANIGDSSGYVMKNKKLHRVTKPHTLVNLLVDAGDLTPEQALNHPKKNVLMKALGAAEKCEPDIFDVDNESSEVFLCSDGLTGMLSDEQIEKVLNEEGLNVEEKVVKLIKKCNARGGNDNISVAYLVRESGDFA